MKPGTPPGRLISLHSASPVSAASCLTNGETRPPDIPAGTRGEGEGADWLKGMARALTESFDVSELAQRITESVLPLFRAQSSSTWLRQADRSLACVAMAGRGSESLKLGDVLPCDIGVVGGAAAAHRAPWAAAVMEAAGVARTEEAGHGGPGASLHAVLAVPLLVKGEVIGAIVTHHADPRGLAQAEIDLAQAFADQVAPAMRNVQLFMRAQSACVEAEAASRAKDDFLVLLAHEFRNSLAPIVTSAALIRRAGPPVGIVQDSAAIVERQARHLARLLDDIGDVARIARGKFELKREPVSVTAVVEEAVEATRRAADLAGLTVSLSVPPVPLWVEADPTRLEQILVNILNNAVKYTPAGGRIEVTAAAENGEAVLRFRDTGIGILPETLLHVFDVLFRSDGARAHTPDGLGLGLTLVRQLVELHGGRVAVCSEGPGRGSEFTVRLPRCPGAQPPGPAADPAPNRGPAYDMLLIEDDADTREALRALLEHEGHRVDVAADGPSGLARDEATRPDVVIIDIGLSGLNGYEVAARIRARRGVGPLLVAVTGYGSAGARRYSLEAGFDVHLTKPVLSDDLLGVLGGLGNRPPAGRGPRRAD